MDSASNTDDHEEMRAVLRGDRRAFARIVGRHQRALYHVALRIVRDDDALASDICQQAFLSAWLNREAFRFQSSVRTWLLRITTNLALNEVRRPHRRRDRPWPDEDDTDGELPADTEDPAVRLDEGRLRHELGRAVSELPARQRAVAALRLGEDLDFVEIGEVLGITTGNAKATYHLAVEKLRRALLARGVAA